MVSVGERRTSLLIRLSREDAARIHQEASSEYRSLSGYLLCKLERSISLEAKALGEASETVKALLSKWGLETIGPQCKRLNIAVHLRCTVEEAARIREWAARRQLSISDFVVFSLRRSWNATDQLRSL